MANCCKNVAREHNETLKERALHTTVVLEHWTTAVEHGENTTMRNSGRVGRGRVPPQDNA